MDKYQRLLLSLMPDGPAWPKNKTSLLSEIASLFSQVVGPKVERLDSVITNLDPRTAVEWLPAWETALSLISTGLSLSERQRRAFAAFVKISDISLAELKRQIREATGFDPVIDEAYPLTVGEIQAGDELDSESSVFVATVKGVPESSELFEILKSSWQAHTLFVIDTDSRILAVRGPYAPD